MGQNDKNLKNIFTGTEEEINTLSGVTFVATAICGIFNNIVSIIIFSRPEMISPINMTLIGKPTFKN